MTVENRQNRPPLPLRTPLPEDALLSQAIIAGSFPAIMLQRPTLAGKEERRRQETIVKLVQRRNALEESPLELTRPLSLRGAIQFIRQITQEKYPSRTTFEGLAKIAVIFGDFPLSPGVIRVDEQNRWHYRFTDKRQLITVLDVARKIAETRDFSLTKISQQAQETFQEKRDQRSPVEALIPLILRQLDFPAETPEGRKRRIKKFLLEKLQAGELPLLPDDLKPQEILILGIPQDGQKDFALLWAEFLEKSGERVARPPLDTILKTWPALTIFLKEQLKGIKINLRSVPQVVTWLRVEGVSVVPLKKRMSQGRIGYYYRLSPLQRARLKILLQSPEKCQTLREMIRGKKN